MSNPLAQSSSDRAVNVVYILSSDSEEEDTKSNVLLSSPHCRTLRSPPSDKARARNHGEDDRRADPPPPNQGIRRARDKVDDEQDLDETLRSTRKFGKSRADGAPHSQIPTTPKTFPRKRHAPDLGEGEDEAEEDTKPEVTYISSDSESEPPAPNKPDKPELPRRKRFRMLMDSVVLPPPRAYTKKNAAPSTSTTAGPNRQYEASRPKASSSSTKVNARGKGKESARNVEPPRGKEPARPEWFKQHLSSVEDQYPETKFRIYFIAEGPQWGVKCLTCKDSKIIVSGPGHSLNNFVRHLKGLSHRMQNGGVIDWHQHSNKGSKAKATQGSSSATTASQGIAGKSSKAYKRPPKLPVQSRIVPAARVPEDPVASFLENIGLSLDYADTLRDAGIKDDARMKALGRLSETALDRLETSLAKKGLDISACLLVIEGLKERAMAA